MRRGLSLAKDPTFGANLDQLTDLTRQLSKITSVETPVMAEESDYEKRDTREFYCWKFSHQGRSVPAARCPCDISEAPRRCSAQSADARKMVLCTRTAPHRANYGEPLGIGSNCSGRESWSRDSRKFLGSVGEEPSHPELLDWLALHFQNDLHWDMKALLRELKNSATYRQRAKSTPALTGKDPRNRLLARGPQQRLTAEMVRDQALMAGGLLTDKMGGPPVMLPQPEGVWNSVYNDSKWVNARGPDRYRRAIYTYIKRTSGYPSFLTFDASEHDVSLARRISTNTPLQALVTLE